MRAPLAILPLFLSSLLGCGRGPDMRTPLDEGLEPDVPVKDGPVKDDPA